MPVETERKYSSIYAFFEYFGEVVLAIILGIFVGAIIMKAGGIDPILAYKSLFVPTFTTTYGWLMTLSFATPIILTGLTFGIGVRAGLFNIGAEGQLYMGALGSVLIAALSLPSFLYLPLEFVAGIVLAVGWALIAGVLKAYKGVNEVVSTIMLNWTAYWIVEYFRGYVVPNPVDASKTVSIPPAGRLPLLDPASELSFAFIISIVVDLLMFFILWYTSLGYEIRAVGYNPKASTYGGISVKRVALYSFILGGITSGIAGVSEIAGRPPSYAITTGLSNIYNLGFDGLTVSLIGMNHPIGIIFGAIFVGALKAGSRTMQIYAHAPLEMVQAVQGIIIIAISIPGLFRIVKKYLKVMKRGQ